MSDRPLSERVWDSFDIPDEQFEYVAAEIAKLEQRLADACDQCAVMDGHVERLKQERAGRVTFWPLDLERRPPSLPPLPSS